MRPFSYMVLVGILAIGCGDGAQQGVQEDAGSGAEAGPLDAAVVDDAGSALDAFDASPASDAAAGDAAPDGAAPDGGRPPYQVPTLAGKVFAGHYITDVLRGYDTTSLAELTGSPATMPSRVSDVRAINSLGVVAVTFEGMSEVRIYDSDTLTEIAGSPYTTAIGSEVTAYDDLTKRLYVFCLDDDGGPASLVNVFDTTSVPYVEVSGSPFAITFTVYYAEVDPVTGVIYVTTFNSLVGLRPTATGLEQIAGSPLALVSNGRTASLALDPARRRAYVPEVRVPGDQLIHAIDLDSMQPVAGSPLTVSGSTFAGDVAVSPASGDVFFIDAGSATLHSLAPGPPLSLRNTCGTNGCAVSPTESGLVLDYEASRLFLAGLPSSSDPSIGPGFLEVWDVSDPAAPSKLGAKPALGTYPIYLALQ